MPHQSRDTFPYHPNFFLLLNFRSRPATASRLINYFFKLFNEFLLGSIAPVVKLNYQMHRGGRIINQPSQLLGIKLTNSADSGAVYHLTNAWFKFQNFL